MLTNDYSRHLSPGNFEFSSPRGILPNIRCLNLGPPLKNTNEVGPYLHLWVITKRRMTLEKVSYRVIYSRI